MIENINEIKEYIDKNKDTDDVKGFMNSLKVEPTFEVFKNKLNETEFKSFLDSEKDKHSAKSLETWKTNNLDKIVEEKIKERYPQADVKDIELNKLKAEIEKMQKDSIRKDLLNKGLQFAQSKKLPVELIEPLVTGDEDTTNKNLELLANVFNQQLEKLVAEKLKGTTPKTGTTTETTTREMFNKMGYLERLKFASEQPELYKEFTK